MSGQGSGEVGFVLPKQLGMVARARWVQLGGPLEGHSIRARPLSGYERLRMMDLGTLAGTAEALIFALSASILEWKTPDQTPFEPTADALKELPQESLDELQTKLAGMLSERLFFESAVPLPRDVSES